MNKLDKSTDCPNTDIELITPIQIVPDLPTIHGNSTFTHTIGKELCDYISIGGNISKFCKQSKHNITDTQVDKWFKANPEFRQEYELACVERAKYRFETLDSINEQAVGGLMHPSVVSVVSKNLMWQAGKDNPKKYGEASLVKLADADGNKLSFSDMMAEITE